MTQLTLDFTEYTCKLQNIKQELNSLPQSKELNTILANYISDTIYNTNFSLPHKREEAFNYITAYNHIGFELLKLNQARRSISSKSNAIDPTKLSDMDKLALEVIKSSPANVMFAQLVSSYDLRRQEREKINKEIQKRTSVKVSSISQEKMGRNPNSSCKRRGYHV